MRRGSKTPADLTATADRAQPDHAWKTLSIVNDWIRHADAKIAVTLAFVGVTSGLLFNLTRTITRWNGLLVVFTVIALLALIAAVGCATIALAPRSRPPIDSTSESANPLFFGDIHRHFRSQAARYRSTLQALTADDDELTARIADQIRVNSRIATIKFRFTNRAIWLEVIAAVAVAAVAVIAGLGG
jgi:hypothetical protein